MATKTTVSPTQINGIEMGVLKSTLDAVKNDPGLGACKFRATNKWTGSTQNCTTVTGFFGAKQEHDHKKKFELYSDEPPILAGKDGAPNPVEHLLNALAGCVTTSMVAHAAVRNIEIQELESELEGDIDLRGFFGMDPNVPKGFTNIRVTFKIKTPEKDLNKIEALAAFSPVFNTLTKGVPVDIKVARK